MLILAKQLRFFFKDRQQSSLLSINKHWLNGQKIRNTNPKSKTTHDSKSLLVQDWLKDLKQSLFLDQWSVHLANRTPWPILLNICLLAISGLSARRVGHRWKKFKKIQSWELNVSRYQRRFKSNSSTACYQVGLPNPSSLTSNSQRVCCRRIWRSSHAVDIRIPPAPVESTRNCHSPGNAVHAICTRKPRGEPQESQSGKP